MAFPIDSAISPALVVANKAMQPVRDTAVHSASDNISISNDALQKMGVMSGGILPEGGTGSTKEIAELGWKLEDGVFQAEFTMDNGNTQTVSIDGGKLEIREFDQGRLVKSVDGTISENGANLDTKFYDANGKVSQSIHTELVELASSGDWTSASMKRDIQWYDDGSLTRQMHDQMDLSTKNKILEVKGGDDETVSSSWLEEVTAKVSDTPDSAIDRLTQEEHLTKYSAKINEFSEGGKISRNLTIEHNGYYTQESSRSSSGGGRTSEINHDTSLFIQLKDYDDKGNLVREATFTDKQKDGEELNDGEQEQFAEVSWYKDGELVKKGYGKGGLSELDGAGLGARPDIMDVLGLSKEEYLTAEPQTAAELLGNNLMESSSEPDYFLEGVAGRVKAGSYDMAADIMEDGSDLPYAMDWTTEYYDDGMLAMRKKDTESAQAAPANPNQAEMFFELGGGLSSQSRPDTLREATHEVEMFKRGMMVSRETTSSRETLLPSDDGPDKLMTRTLVTKEVGGEKTTESILSEGGIDEVDADAHAAAKGMSEENKLTLDALGEVTDSLNGEEDIRKGSNNYVEFDYKPKSSAALF